MSKLPRNIAIAIEGEMNYQDGKWGTIEVHPHEVGAWLTIMRNELQEAEDEWMKGSDADALLEILQVVSVGVQCMKQHGVATRDGVRQFPSASGEFAITRRCPTCNSPDPKRHPAVQFEGEVQVCSDSFHAQPRAEGNAAQDYHCVRFDTEADAEKRRRAQAGGGEPDQPVRDCSTCRSLVGCERARGGGWVGFPCWVAASTQAGGGRG